MSPQEIRAAMADFPHKVILAEEYEGKHRLAFNFEKEGMSIHNIRESSCSRFEGTAEMYGITQAQFEAFDALSVGIEKIADDALNTIALSVQNLLGVDSGDVATRLLGEDALQPIRTTVLNYVVAEINTNLTPPPEEAASIRRHRP